MKNAFSFIFGFLTVSLLSASFYFYFGRNEQNLAIESINLTANAISEKIEEADTTETQNGTTTLSSTSSEILLNNNQDSATTSRENI